jgi:hypothetical protein
VWRRAVGLATQGPYADAYVYVTDQDDDNWLITALDASAHPPGSVGWEAWARTTQDRDRILEDWQVRWFSEAESQRLIELLIDDGD